MKGEVMLCEICDEPFAEGELMVRVPAIGWMHQNCEPSRDSFFGRLGRIVEEDVDNGR